MTGDGDRPRLMRKLLPYLKVRLNRTWRNPCSTLEGMYGILFHRIVTNEQAVRLLIVMKKIKVLLLLLVLAISEVVSAQSYQVGVCDWMILKRQKLGEFKWARDIGADGVELDMGGLGKREAFDNQLRDDKVAAQFKHVADSSNLKIGSVAMSGFYGQNFSTKETYKELLTDCFDTMDKMGGVKVCFLPLGGCGKDWATTPAVRKEVVKRLREVGEMAKKRGKVIGIDTPFDAKGNLKFLKEIKSDGIKIFYKWQTAIENGVDICEDMKKLGAKNICAIHSSNTDGVCLRDDKALDVPAIKATLDKMGWSGWLFIERSRNANEPRNVLANFSNNANYLKSIFNSLPEPEVALKSEGRNPEYVNTILGRSQKVIDALGQSYTPKGANIRNIVANKYFELNDIYEERDELKKTNKQLAEAQCDQKLYRSHFAFDSNLSKYLKPYQVEIVKDVMTYNVVKVTYDAQCDMIPTLTEEEKAQIMTWLKEAREYAVDAESSKKKHEVFGKYKGRINNYLSKRGYNLTKEREEWGKRVKARGGTL